MEASSQIILEIPDKIDRKLLFGSLNNNLKEIEKNTKAQILERGENIVITGAGAGQAKNILNNLIAAIATGKEIDEQMISYAVDLECKSEEYSNFQNSKDIIVYTKNGKPIRPKTIGQKKYINQIRKNEMVFGIGPAGTGKTYLACAMAAKAYKNNDVQKIILTRPAVESGESLGFLPGALEEKVDPYLRPLYDALFDIFGKENTKRLKEKEIIEVVPLAYMRGRTLDNSFIILDEAQNTTKEQMKMFLTRMGMGSKVVVTGDITQIDLPNRKTSGLSVAIKVLKNIEGIEFSYLDDVDVVRHKLVKEIIKAYGKFEERN